MGNLIIMCRSKIYRQFELQIKSFFKKTHDIEQRQTNFFDMYIKEEIERGYRGPIGIGWRVQDFHEFFLNDNFFKFFVKLPIIPAERPAGPP